MDSISEAIATATYLAASAARATSEAVQAATGSVRGATQTVGNTARPAAVRLVEQGTETVGRIVTPIAEHPLIKFAAKRPLCSSWAGLERLHSCQFGP